MTAASTIVMPKLGLTMTEGILASWHVTPGDEVRTGDILFVVETEKIATEITARADGKIETIKVAAGETVPVGGVIATWTGPALGEDIESEPARAEAQRESPPARSNGAGVEAPFCSAPVRRGRVLATPQARRLARAQGLDLHSIKGSGPRGRIKASDLAQHQAGPSSANAEVASPAPTPAGRASSAASDRRTLSTIEKTVARRLTAAKREIPHFYVMAEADISSLVALRGELNSNAGGAPKISINHLMLLATGRALVENPAFNIVWDQDDVVTLSGSDVGFAVDTPQGLFAPVLRDVGMMRVDELAKAAISISERARQGSLRTEDLSGGAVTISNVGMFGASWIAPIINPGQSSIIGVGATKSEFRPDSAGAPALRGIVSLVLSADHRILDGVKGARFLNAIVRFLEHPLELIR